MRCDKLARLKKTSAFRICLSECEKTPWGTDKAVNVCMRDNSDGVDGKQKRAAS